MVNANPVLEFDAERHIYRLDGRVLPSVTQILEPLQIFQGVPREVLERAREFGSHVHLAVHLFNIGELDESTLDPALVPYLDGWKRFIVDTGFKVTASEIRVVHPIYGYAGTIDAIGFLKLQPTIIEVKSGVVPLTVGAQLAAYQHAYSMATIRRRLCVQLIGNGKYKLHPQKNPADFPLFLSCLNVYKFLAKHKKGESPC